MAKTVSEHVVKVTSESNLGAENKKLKASVVSLSDSLSVLHKRNERVNKSNKAANDAEMKLKNTREKHASVIRDLSTTTSTMVGPLNAITGRMSALSSLTSRVGIGMAIAGAGMAAAVYAINGALRGSLAAFSTMEEQQLRIEGVLRATGGAAGFTADELDRMARSVARDTLASSAQVRDGIATLLTFKSVQGDTFERSIRLAQDKSAVFKQDLNSSVKQLGKVLEDPVNNLSALARTGVTFNEQQRETIKNLQEQGELLAAQSLILETIAGQVEGAAKSAGSGLAGTVDLFMQQKEEFLEALSSVGAGIGDTKGWIPTWWQNTVGGAGQIMEDLTNLMTTTTDEWKERLLEIENDGQLQARVERLAKRRADAYRQIEIHGWEGVREATRIEYNRTTQMIADLTKERNDIIRHLNQQEAEKQSAEEAGKIANLEREKAAVAETLAANTEAYEKLYASIGAGAEKQRRLQKKIHEEKLQQIQELNFTDDQANAIDIEQGGSGTGGAAGLKQRLTDDAIAFYESQMDKIDQAEANKAKAAANREMRLQEQKKSIVEQYNAWLDSSNSDQLSKVDAWHKQQLAKLRKYKEDSAKLGVELDTSGQEQRLFEEAEARKTEILRKESEKRLEEQRRHQQAKQELERQYMRFRAQLTDDEFTALDLEYEIKLEKLMTFLENKAITEEEFNLRKGELDVQRDDARLQQKFGKEQAFGNAVIALKNREAGAEMQMAGMVVDQLAKTSKKAFAIKKALAIKDTIMATYNNAVLAYQSLVKIPYIGPFLGAGAAVAAVAMGMAQVNQIRNQSFDGARRYGGGVQAGNSYLVGEEGPEIATFGAQAQITSLSNLKKAIGEDTAGGGGINLSIPISAQALDAEGVGEVLMRSRQEVYDAVREVLAEEGRDF